METNIILTICVGIVSILTIGIILKECKKKEKEKNKDDGE